MKLTFKLENEMQEKSQARCRIRFCNMDSIKHTVLIFYEFQIEEGICAFRYRQLICGLFASIDRNQKIIFAPTES